MSGREVVRFSHREVCETLPLSGKGLGSGVGAGGRPLCTGCSIAPLWVLITNDKSARSDPYLAMLCHGALPGCKKQWQLCRVGLAEAVLQPAQAEGVLLQVLPGQVLVLLVQGGQS